MKDKIKETLTSILSYLLKVERRTLLWTNPSPTNTFAEQTVSLSLSDYSAVEIVYKLFTNQQYNVTGQRTYMGDQSITISASGTAGYFSGAIALMARASSMNISGVHFSAASLAASTGSWAPDNRCLIPYKIYGIKSGGGTA